MKIQLDLTDEINSKLKLLKTTRNDSSLKDTINFILEGYFESHNILEKVKEFLKK